MDKSLLLGEIPALVWCCDPRGLLSYVNPELAAFAGREPEPDCGFEWLLENVYAEDWPRRAAQLRRDFLRRQPFRTSYRLHHANGECRWILETGVPVWNEDGFKGLAAVGLDVTRDKNREQSLEIRDRERNELVGSLSHELRNSLTGVLGMLESLERTPLTDEQRQLASVAIQSSRTVLRVAEDVLEAFRWESDEVSLEYANLHLQAEMGNLVEKFGRLAREQGLEFSWEVDPGLPPVVRGDRARLDQILTNLITNAVKYTRDGSVSLRVLPGDPGTIRFEVQDTGDGIPQESQQKIFQPFSRLSEGHGSGLGLAICRRLVQLMDGDLGLCSLPGEGSTFWFELPLEAAAEPETGDSEEGSLPPLQVLVVEDEPVNRQVICMLLETMGVSPNPATDGQQALSLLERSPVDVVLMDYRMPNLDGIEATRLLRQRWGTGPVVIGLTGDVRPEVVRHCLEAGMNDCLHKPVSASELKRALLRWSRGR